MLILFYNSFYGAAPDLSDLTETDRRCFTSDLGRFDAADAVVFHLPTLGPVTSLHKREGQLWVLWSVESVINYPAQADPDFLKFFDLIMTYERKSDVWFPYLPYRATWDAALGRPVPAKTASVPSVMFQSSAFNRSGRIGYAAELMKHTAVDSFGKVLRTAVLADDDGSDVAKLRAIGRYKFCIAMENSVCDDYVTEKFFQPLLTGTVPVYLGARNVATFAPGDDCYIDVRDFSGPRALADHLNALDKDDAAYRRLLAWRRKPIRPSFALDYERRGLPFFNLLEAVRSRLSSPGAARAKPLQFTFDPARYSPGNPTRASVVHHLYPQALPVRSTPGRRGRSLAIRLAHRCLAFLRRPFAARTGRP
jgi:hypothetical protein